MTAAPSHAADALPRLKALETYVRDIAVSQAFWAEHFGLAPSSTDPHAFQHGDIIWRLLDGAEPCGTRGPHFALPAFEIVDFGQARGYLLAHDIPIVFEEMLPGLNLLIFLDPDATPIQLIQLTDPRVWDIADRRELRTRRRRDDLASEMVGLGPLGELTIYSHDISASGRFYRQLIGLPPGLSFFGHIHLLAENLPVVLRHTNWRCKHPGRHHATSPIFAVPDLSLLAQTLAAAGYSPDFTSPDRLTVIDPAGLRLHFEQMASGK